MQTAIEIVSLLLVGLIAGAELGSWCCVQPVVARLPYEQYVAAEQAMLRTFGRVMPLLMPLSGIFAIALIFISRGESNVVLWLRVAAALCIAVTVVTTLAVNVPINNRTAVWQVSSDMSDLSRRSSENCRGAQADWQRMRTRWHFFQGVRGWLFAAAFVFLASALVLARH